MKSKNGAHRHSGRATPRSPDDPITIADLKWCLDRVALVMHRAGKKADVYLPIFERLESELDILKKKEAALERARVRAARVMQEHSIKN
ncbi:hypothetical protein NLM16_01260 [Bradyrhizobium brasilense]|uniref:hypothetical protein n=1 Tax=Bradyrhizobium brasilense TaxID=1419277 RepID=UPI002877AFBB|nr:hypothetical protein [Bradyrhizobium brasilense]MCP3412723.1 hypothetical protein [Bradyrhizobium brasilense]